jgi:UTP--glucose-1-phosphate uridylyltransferase
MHALTPTIMELLADEMQNAGDMSINLAGALSRLATKERYLAFEVPGRRYNIGVKYGLLNAQLALSLSGVDREEVLAQLVELLATRDSLHDA